MAITNIQINTHHMLKKACLKRDVDFGQGLYPNVDLKSIDEYWSVSHQNGY